jgi:hypothetical protein
MHPGGLAVLFDKEIGMRIAGDNDYLFINI